MKLLIFVISLLFSSYLIAEDRIKLDGTVDEQTLAEIKLAFNQGVDVILENHVLRTLPKNLSKRIYKIQGNEGYFTIYFTQRDKQYGHDILSAKYVCSTEPKDSLCSLMFHNHINVQY